jgi:hypothetical protein
MTRSSSDQSRRGTKRWVLVGVATTAVIAFVFAGLLAATPLADPSRGPAAANAPVGAAPCATTVHGFLVGQSALTADFIPAGFKNISDPAQSGVIGTYRSVNGGGDPPWVRVNLSILKGKLTGSVGGLSAPTGARVQGHPALLESGAFRGLPFIGLYWKKGSGHLLSVVGYKLPESMVLRVAAHVHARVGLKTPLALSPGRIVSRSAAVSKARQWVSFRAASARAKLSSWTEVLTFNRQFFLAPGFPPTPWHPIWAVMLTRRGHGPRLVVIDAHSGRVAFSASDSDRSGWFEALTDRDPTVHSGCPGGTSARLPFGIMTRTEEAFTLRGSGGSSLVGRVRVKNIVIMKLTTISAVHYIGCTQLDCGPYDLLWPRISVTLAPPGKLLPCVVSWGHAGRVSKPKMTKEYFSISAGNNSESGCGPLPHWVTRLRDLAPPIQT